MSDSIRVMFYDKSEWAGETLTSSWFAGGLLYKAVRRVDVCIGVESWDEAFDWLLSVKPDKKISMVQFWGHGSPGNVWVNKSNLNNNIVRNDNKYHEKALKLKERLTDDAIIWLRCCSVFAGDKGYAFAKRWSKFFDCTVAAHTYIIGPFQSGLHTIKSGEEPTWPLEEGLDKDGKSLWSKPWSTNTIVCMKASIPKGW